MIVFLVTPPHYYTLKAVEKALPRVVRVIDYHAFFAAGRLPGGTYIFGDLERLSEHELRIAAEAYRQLAVQPGVRALNDPARVLTRYGLLRTLFEAGINDFDAYRADALPKPRRFPVFVRWEPGHDKPSELLHDQTALDAALAELVAKGEPLRGMLVTEYAAEPVIPGVFRRHATFRIADEFQLFAPSSERDWRVKYGERGLVTEKIYLNDERAMQENRFGETLRRTFEIAGVEYGRADFGLVGGKPQIYEINTNPTVGVPAPHDSPARTRALARCWSWYLEKIAALDTETSARKIKIDSPLLSLYRSALTTKFRSLFGWRLLKGDRMIRRP